MKKIVEGFLCHGFVNSSVEVLKVTLCKAWLAHDHSSSKEEKSLLTKHEHDFIMQFWPE